MIIPHLNAHGKLNGDPHFVKGEVVPRFDRFTPKRIANLLKEISAKTNVKWFQVDGLWYIHSLNFKEHQPGLREDRSGKDLLPDYQVLNKSGSTPGLLPPEVEVEVEVEVEGEGEGEGEGVHGVSPRTRNLSDEEFLKELKNNPAYKNIDIDTELSRMDAWLLTPQARGRRKTRRFIVAWLNRIDRPIEPGAPPGAAKLCTAGNPMPPGAQDRWRHPDAEKGPDGKALCPHCTRFFL